MFGLWKYYERQFTAFEDGYSVQTSLGLKFLLPEERDLLIASYRKAMAFDIKRILLSSLIIVGVIMIAILPIVIFDLPAIAMDIATYVAILGVMLFVSKPWWDHYQLSRRLYAQARTLPQTKSWRTRCEEHLSTLSWIRIILGLLIYGWVLYLLIWADKPLEPFLIVIGIATAAGTVYLSLVALWKLTLKANQPD